MKERDHAVGEETQGNRGGKLAILLGVGVGASIILTLFIREVRQLNANLEAINNGLREFSAEAAKLREVLEDFRQMTAPWLGYKVVDKGKDAALNPKR